MAALTYAGPASDICYHPARWCVRVAADGRWYGCTMRSATV